MYTPPTELYTLSLHDALPICKRSVVRPWRAAHGSVRHAAVAATDTTSRRPPVVRVVLTDRKSTRLNSSHLGISYAVFCLKKKKTTPISREQQCAKTYDH